jgi:hypothetical protein
MRLAVRTLGDSTGETAKTRECLTLRVLLERLCDHWPN